MKKATMVLNIPRYSDQGSPSDQSTEFPILPLSITKRYTPESIAAVAICRKVSFDTSILFDTMSRYEMWSAKKNAHSNVNASPFEKCKPCSGEYVRNATPTNVTNGNTKNFPCGRFLKNIHVMKGTMITFVAVMKALLLGVVN